MGRRIINRADYAPQFDVDREDAVSQDILASKSIVGEDLADDGPVRATQASIQSNLNTDARPILLGQGSPAQAATRRAKKR